MILNPKLLLAAGLIIIGIFLLASPQFNFFPQTNPPTSLNTTATPTPSPLQNKKTLNGSAKGVVMLENPAAGTKIRSPLLVSGFVYSKKGILTITLKQKETGIVVTTPKTVKIEGQADKISFAEAIQFGLPVKPQTGILEISFKDESGKNADDKFQIEVEFPSDLGR